MSQSVNKPFNIRDTEVSNLWIQNLQKIASYEYKNKSAQHQWGTISTHWNTNSLLYEYKNKSATNGAQLVSGIPTVCW